MFILIELLHSQQGGRGEGGRGGGRTRGGGARTRGGRGVGRVAVRVGALLQLVRDPRHLAGQIVGAWTRLVRVD